MSKYATVKEIIKEVQAVREVQKKEGVLSARAEDEKNLIVDVIPFLESLEKYETVGEMIELYNYDTDEYTDIEGSELFEELEESGEIVEENHDNTYNWNSPISNDLDFIKYKNVETDEVYIKMMVHLGGDPRGNYTDYILLKFNDEWEYMDAFYENSYNGCVIGSKSIYFENVEYKGNLYNISVDSYWHGELATYYITDEHNNEVHSGDDYFGCEYDEIKERITEILSEVVE